MVKTTGWIFSHFRKLEVQDQDASIGEGPLSSLQTPSSCVPTWQSDFSDIVLMRDLHGLQPTIQELQLQAPSPKNSVDTNIQSVPPPPISGSLTSQMEGVCLPGCLTGWPGGSDEEYRSSADYAPPCTIPDIFFFEARSCQPQTMICLPSTRIIGIYYHFALSKTFLKEKKFFKGTGKMAYQLKAFSALTEDLAQFPVPTVAHNHL